MEGELERIVVETLDHPERSQVKKDLEFVVSALSILGRCDEAVILYNDNLRSFNSEQQIQCRFFLGVGFTRRSEYATARRYFGENRRLTRTRLSFQSKFFVFQGMGFYRFFCGKWNLALRDSARSFQAALRGNFLLGRVLSSDLRGNLLVQMGQVDLGLRTLHQAHVLASRMKNLSLSQAIDGSRLNYLAQFGLSPKDTIQSLRSRIEELDRLGDAYYSICNLNLELARQYLIRGKFSDANSALDTAAQVIYSHQYRRQEILLNLRYGYMSYLTGDSARGLTYVQAARRALEPIDHTSRLAVLGLELKLVTDLQMKDRIAQLREELRAGSVIYGGVVHRKILERQKILDSRQSPRGGDVIAELKDQMEGGTDQAIEAILQTEFRAFLLDVLPSVRGRRVIYLDLGKDTVTIFDRTEIDHSQGLTSLLRLLLFEIGSGPCTKEHLIHSVWRYTSYHPLHHDPVIYQAIANLRRLLGVHADWIQTTEEGYRLQAGIELRSVRHREISRPAPTAVELIPAIKSDYDKRLNFRQIRFLRQIKRNQFVTVQDYRKLFKVSEITACRDLALLYRFGFVLRVGRARATRYQLSGGNK